MDDVRKLDKAYDLCLESGLCSGHPKRVIIASLHYLYLIVNSLYRSQRYIGRLHNVSLTTMSKNVHRILDSVYCEEILELLRDV